MEVRVVVAFVILGLAALAAATATLLILRRRRAHQLRQRGVKTDQHRRMAEARARVGA